MAAPPRLPKLNATHAAFAVAGVSLLLSAGLVWELRQARQDLEREVEQGVSAGIQDGVGAALGPAQVEATSAAAAKGLVGGLVDGAANTLGGPAGSEQAERGRAALGGAGLELLEGALGVEPEPAASAAPDEPSPAAPARPQRARRAGELAGEAVDLGLDVVDGLLGITRPRDEAPPAEEDRDAERAPR